MKRSEILIIINLILLLGIAGFSVLVWTSTISSYNIIEQNTLNATFSHFLTGIEDQEEQITRQARDYAWWDDTYRYLRGEYPAYITDNFEGQTLENLNIQLIGYADANGDLFSQTRIHPDSPGIDENTWDTIGPLVITRHETDVTTTLVTLNDTSFLLCGVPILHSDSSGPIAGTLIFGRRINDTFLRSLEKIVHYPVSFEMDRQEEYPDLISETRVPSYPSFTALNTGEEAESISNAFFTVSSDGRRLLVFRLTRPKTVAIEGREIIGKTLQFLIIFTFLYLLIITGIIMGAFSRYETTLTELEDKNREIRMLEERRRISDSIEEILRVFLQFKSDTTENISSLVALAADMLHGDCAIYTKLINGEDHLIASSRLPDQYIHPLNPDGKIYTSITGRYPDEICMVQSPINPEFRVSDPLVREFGFQSFFGCCVKAGVSATAYISIYNHQPFRPEKLEGAMMHLIIRAIEVEETRAEFLESLERRDVILESVSHTASNLIQQVRDPDLHSIFRMLGGIVHADRVYLLTPPDGRTNTERTIRLDPWVREEGCTLCRPLIPYYTEWKDEQADWISLLRRGEFVAGSVNTFPREKREVLRRYGVQSLALFPVFRRKNLFGILVFEENNHPHEWILPECRALMTAAALIGSAIDRFEIERENESYTQQLAEKTHELALMNVEIQERTVEIEELLEKKNELITQIGHDIRTPLTPVIGLLPLIRDSTTDPKVLSMIELVETGAYRIRDLLEKILFLRQMRIMDGDRRYGSADIHAIICDIYEKNRVFLEQSGITFEHSVQEGTGAHIPDKSLNLILDEILRNAIRFTPTGGRITVKTELRESSVSVMVSDNGIGLSQRDRGRIFEDFFKADTSRHEIDTHGLGLPIVRKIVEKYHGTITVSSEGPGQGTSVTVTLPAREKMDHQAPAGNTG